jgi:hypothetical protein
MLKKIIDSLHLSKIDGLAKAFQGSGRIGFWSQLVLGSFPIILMLFIFSFSGSVSGPRAGLPVVGYLTIANLLVLIFTTIWFYRYIGLGKRIGDAATRPSESAVVGTVWTGLVASSLGILFSLVVMLLEVGQLLFYFLTAPQGGIPTLQTTPSATAGGSWVSAVDLASLLALVLMLGAEVIATLLGMWLLFRTTQSYDKLESSAR